MMMLMSNTEKQRDMLEQTSPPQADDYVNEQHRETKCHFGTEYTTVLLINIII
jgi:hypothetical protein